jgi:dienelactone hydrolase
LDKHLKEVAMANGRIGVGLALAAALWASGAPAAPLPQDAVLTNGIRGKLIKFESRNPKNFEDIVANSPAPAVSLNGLLFIPTGPAAKAAVIIVPGSGGVSESHLLHANALTSAGLVALIVDPFTGRGVADTIADQSAFSFAASAYDVLAAAKFLTSQGLDASQIGAVGYSRGGIAVLMAASAQLAPTVLGPGKALGAVLGAWPWCGFQFQDARTAPTAVRFDLADRDNWVSPVQCQGWATAMRTHNPKVSVRFFENADHAFGYNIPVREIPNAITAYNAPILYLDNEGRYLDWYSGAALAGKTDKDLLKMAAPWVGRGVRLGTKPGQTDAFIADMVDFFGKTLIP